MKLHIFTLLFLSFSLLVWNAIAVAGSPGDDNASYYEKLGSKNEHSIDVTMSMSAMAELRLISSDLSKVKHILDQQQEQQIALLNKVEEYENKFKQSGLQTSYGRGDTSYPIVLTQPCCSEDSGSSIPSIVLTAVAVLVTVLGVFIAILALWGYKEARRNIDQKVTQRTEELIHEKFENGEFDSLVALKLEEIAYGTIISGRELEQEQGE